MSVSKIKNLILLILALAIIGLLPAVVPTQAARVGSEKKVHEKLEALYESYGLSLDASSLPASQTLYSIELENPDAKPAAQALLGGKAAEEEAPARMLAQYSDTPDGRLHGAKVYLDKVSVGATMNIIIAATLARGRTVIENAAREPHIVDLANFLNSMGADIRGAGTDSIRIQGVERLHGGTYSVIPDQIEAGTYMTACAAAGGEVLLTNVIPRHLECISAKLREMGVTVVEGGDSVLVRSNGRLRHTNVKTQPYPGFPTDMQPRGQ